MPQWNPDATVLEHVGQASSDAPMAPRYLPHGRISSLFWQFRAWFAALAAVLDDALMQVDGVLPAHHIGGLVSFASLRHLQITRSQVDLDQELA